MLQSQYWTELLELRTHAYYLELYQIKCERIELFISIILAVTSSASIGAWAIWKCSGQLIPDTTLSFFSA